LPGFCNFKNSPFTSNKTFLTALCTTSQITPGVFSIAKNNGKYIGLIEILQDFITSGNVNMQIYQYNEQLIKSNDEDAGSLCHHFGETLYDEKYEKVKKTIEGLHKEFDVFSKHKFTQDYNTYDKNGKHLFVKHLDDFNKLL